MRKIAFSWPGGKAGALTTSWDDGQIHDRRLVEILNRFGIKGTWNLNSGKLAGEGENSSTINAGEVSSLFAEHEVACHTVTHPYLERLPEELVLWEILEDRKNLEALTGYPVKGLALPFGTYDARVLRLIRQCGIVHSRTVHSHNKFHLPADFVEWHPTCHHKANLKELWAKFMGLSRERNPDKLFYLWGHSYEFERDSNWDIMENFGAEVAGHGDIWHATNMEIYTYVTAWRGLWCGLDVRSFHNPAGVDVWMRVDGEVALVKSGATLRI